MQPSTLENTQTEAGIVAALATETAKPFIETAGRQPVMITRDDQRIISLELQLQSPLRIKGTNPRFYSLRDLQTYLVGQVGKNANPVVFADRKTLSFVAFLDYHHQGAAAGDITEENHRWLDHTACLQYEHSLQFKRWKEKDGVKFTQSAFAEFLEDNLADIVAPSGSEVLSFAATLEATSTEVFKSSVKLSTGETKFTFTNERTGDQDTKIIDQIIIGIPLWERGEKVQISAKLMHRLEEVKDTTSKQVKFWFKLRQLDAIIDTLWAEDIGFLRTSLQGIAPVYEGIPPVKPTPLNFTNG